MTAPTTSVRQHPLFRLEEDDLNMVLSFVLVSGSIKDLATQYGVSYPTMRQRLNTLIERVRQLKEQAPADPVSDYLADLIAKGRITSADARRLRDLHRGVLEDQNNHPPTDSNGRP